MSKRTEMNLLLCQTECEMAMEKFYKALDKHQSSKHKLAVAMEEAGIYQVFIADRKATLNRGTGDIEFSMRDEKEKVNE